MKDRKQEALSLMLAAVLTLGAAAYAAEGHEHPGSHQTTQADQVTHSNVVTLEGEVLDLSCYMDHEGKGKEHQKCAMACLVEKKTPAGLLTAEGSVYLLVQDHESEKVFIQVRALAAEKVRITGKKAQRGGLQAILVQKVEKI